MTGVQTCALPISNTFKVLNFVLILREELEMEQDKTLFIYDKNKKLLKVGRLQFDLKTAQWQMSIVTPWIRMDFYTLLTQSPAHSDNNYSYFSYLSFKFLLKVHFLFAFRAKARPYAIIVIVA